MFASVVYREGAIKETGPYSVLSERKHNNTTTTFRRLFSEDPSSQNHTGPEITPGDDLTGLNPVLKAPHVRKASFSVLINKCSN